MRELFDLALPWWMFALRGVVVYLAVLAMLRLSGKRSFGDLSPFNIVVLIVVGGSLRTAIVGKDASLIGPLIAVAAILLVNKAFGWLGARWLAFNRLVGGSPAVLARRGRRDPAALRRHDIGDPEFERELHAAGLEDESTVLLARLEPNGKITLIRRAPRDTQTSTGPPRA
ncbi:hypothetical protein QMK61_15530 [Fulvimonas sp. R45]|uniref:DUF421 domain-containing protein n=1 Tax=Fulvimonas sp. R45 TaxID=3045937 RepID=UPI002660068B|nr:YetF domain-containing protein [Fulvimonas sp. R45]MDO1530248.1 hypothetical protein [Fulvimonas sp. R45]